MVERVIKDLRLSNLNGRKIRDTRCLLFMDENCGPNDIEKYKSEKEKAKHRVRLGNCYYDKPFISKVNEENYQKYNNLKESRLPQPYRDYENYTDPLSHFLTPGYDKNRYLHPTVKTEPVTEPTPTNSDPNKINSNRLNCPNIFEELNRGSENDPPGLSYHGRLNSSDACKAKLRAEARMKFIDNLKTPDPDKRITFISNAFPEFTAKRLPNASENDLKALKFMYTSTVQKAYEDIPFNSYLHPRRWGPVSTKESCADPLRPNNTANRCYPSVNDWRNGVNLSEFEAKQLRPDHFLAPRPHDFCAPKKRCDQIPSYSGCVGAYNMDDIDNPYVKDFKPFTTLRSEVPKFGDCTDRNVFVGYTGKIPHLPANLKPPFHTDPRPRNVLGEPC